MHGIEEDNIQRGKGADYSAAHEQEERIVEFILLIDFVRDQRGGKGNPCGHDDETQIDAIHADMIVESDRGNPGYLVDELIPFDSGLEAEKEEEGKDCREARGEDRNSAVEDPKISRDGQQKQSTQQRNEQNSSQ